MRQVQHGHNAVRLAFFPAAKRTLLSLFEIIRVGGFHSSSSAKSLDASGECNVEETFSTEGTIEGESWCSSSSSLAISLARCGGIGGGAPSAMRKRSPISAQMALECSSSI